MRALFLSFLIVVGISTAAIAQQTVLQQGNWTPGNAPKYSIGSSNNPVVIDSGLTPGSAPVTIVASLPTCQSSNKGQTYVVTDALSPTYGATLTGGSTTTALAVCNGVNWTAH